MLSIGQFEKENRNEIDVLFDRLIGYQESLFSKLDYKKLVIFLYHQYKN